MLMERQGVAVEPALILEPALDEIERDLWQPPLRHAVQVFDIDGLIDPHLAYDLLALRQRCNIAYFRITPQSPGRGMRHVHGADLAQSRTVKRSTEGELWIM